MINYKIGDIVLQRSFGEVTRKVLIEGKEENIKNGKSGFYGTIVGHSKWPDVWGYDDQIVEVENV